MIREAKISSPRWRLHVRQCIRSLLFVVYPYGVSGMDGTLLLLFRNPLTLAKVERNSGGTLGVVTSAVLFLL